MNIVADEALCQRLASEYVLGTLKGGARRRFAVLMARHFTLRLMVAEWQQRLAPMAEFAGAVTPPKRVWVGIERRLDLPRRAGGWQFWRSERLAFWRSLGLVSSALAALLLVVVLGRLQDQPQLTHVAVLADAGAHSVLVVTADRRHQALEVRLLGDTRVAADKSLQLWAVPKSGAPRSLGVLGAHGGTFTLPASATGADVALLAVSLEPKGGSPDPKGPTGPILYTGSWARI